MSIDTLSGLTRPDRDKNSYAQIDQPIDDSFGTGSPLTFKLVGGYYESGGQLLGAPFKASADGKLQVDTEISISGVTIDNIKVFSTDQTVANANYGRTDVSGNMFIINQGVAETTVPTAVADGVYVPQWHDEYGRQVTFGDNLSVDAKDVNQVNQALLNTLSVTNLSAVTTSGAGTAIDMSNYNKFTTQYIASAVTSGAVINLQGSLDNSNWYDIGSKVITTSGASTSYDVVSDEKHNYVRTNITNGEITDGTFTTIIFGGN